MTSPKIKSGIKTIFLDLFGVLLGVDQSVILQYISRQSGLSYNKTKEIVLGECYMKLERGESSFPEYIKEMISLLPGSVSINPLELKDMWMNSKVGEMPAVSLLPELRTHYTLWVISNTTDSHIQHLKSKFDFLHKMAGIITSQHAKSRKPEVGIFKFALDCADAEAHRSVFVDDSYNNVHTAESLGFQSHHYREFESFRSFIII